MLLFDCQGLKFWQYFAMKIFMAFGVFGMVFGLASLMRAEDAAVTLKDAYREYFAMGTAINRSVTTEQGWRRSQDLVKADVALVKAQFNQVVAENEMKWMSVHPRPGKDGYDWQAADEFVAFGVSNHMQMAGHTLVWHSQTPNWVFEGTHLPPGVAPSTKPNERPRDPRARGFDGFRPFDLHGPRASREELLERMREHIFAVMGRYKGKIQVWDVVNEALSDGGPDVLRESPWSVIIGPDFIEKAFLFAHEADPNAILRYNDYGLENPEKRKKLLTLIEQLQAKKVPVMAIGSQAHLNVSTRFEEMDQCLTEIKTLGLPIHITELDVNSAFEGQRGTNADVGDNAAATRGGLVAESDKRLTTAYADIFRAFLKHRDAVKLVTFWGVNDANSWRRDGRPLLFDQQAKAKPAFSAVVALPKQLKDRK